MSKVEKNVQNLKNCRCKDCPSFSLYCRFKTLPEDTMEFVEGIEDAKHYEGIFCAFGASECIDSEHGCNCGDCPVAKSHSLTHHYYCTHQGGE